MGILKSQKLIAELTIKLHMSNHHEKSQINYPMNVVSYAQIAFKKLIFQSTPANALRAYHNVLILRMCIGRSSQVSMGHLDLSLRTWDCSSILCTAVSPIHKYRSFAFL